MGRGHPILVSHLYCWRRSPRPKPTEVLSRPDCLDLNGQVCCCPLLHSGCKTVVLRLSRSDHVRPGLKDLHWLSVVYRIKFKLALVMFTIHTHQCPDYLTDSANPYSNNDPARYRAARRPAPTTLYTTYEDEIWRQRFLCGRASRVEEFAINS